MELTGRITADAKLSTVKDGRQVVNFTIAINDSYKLYNARVDWDAVLGVDGVSIAAWGKNLANEEYYTSSLCLYNTVGYTASYPGEPRTFGVTAQYKF